MARKSERGAANSESLNKNKSKLNRGQQRGKKSPPKRDYLHLPVIPEVQEIPENERICPCCKALTSLERHWQGFTTFVEHSEVLMDNNTAERGLRGGVVGRKNYYGSGSIASAEFTAIMFTIIQTLLIWEVNPQAWFSGFFDFIGSNWDKNFEHWLPWNMSSEHRAELSPKKHHDPP